MSTNVGLCAKAIVSAVAAACSAAVPALRNDGSVSLDEWLVILGAALVGSGLTYVVPNAGASTSSTKTPPSEPESAPDEAVGTAVPMHLDEGESETVGVDEEVPVEDDLEEVPVEDDTPEVVDNDV